MNKEQVTGRVEEVKGKIKEVAGHVVGNKELEEKGAIQKNAGKVLADLGDYAADAKSRL
ncbi:CsbD family protein [uncultured Thiodictyon sp.]|uniref:CsbD family protein n=1 Tax=uncultured Thiodictyon sp. TaxID=1846217 RepID=UPI0025DFAF0A|nr:CsbD family protein [uncultured Thiodictyon sp.]